MTQKNKIRVRRVPATDLRAGDMFFSQAGFMVKVLFRSKPAFGQVIYSCIDADGFPSMEVLVKSDSVIKVTDPRAYSAREA